jgi:hypothetical protein
MKRRGIEGDRTERYLSQLKGDCRRVDRSCDKQPAIESCAFIKQLAQVFGHVPILPIC